MFKWVKAFVSPQLMTSSLALAAAPTLSKWTMGAVITWPVPCAAANSAGSAWRRSPTCTTSGTGAILARVSRMSVDFPPRAAMTLPRFPPSVRPAARSGGRSLGAGKRRFCGSWGPWSALQWASPSLLALLFLPWSSVSLFTLAAR